MIKSMTAFGRAVGESGGKNYICEIRSVNSRYLDISVKLPRAYGFLEEKIISSIRENGITRGKIEVYVGIEITQSVGTTVLLDSAYAEGYINALKQLRDTFGLSDDISTMSVASNRDLFLIKKPDEDMEKDWQDFSPILQTALTAFNAAREKEGMNLREDLLNKKNYLVTLTAKIAELSKQQVCSYRERLEGRLRAHLGELDMEFDSQRILTECAIFADKVAVDEELVRLGSHFASFDEAMNSSQPVGRRLDFLLQEMNREINTTGSKCNDSGITALVVDAKCELEKIREQIQNLE